MIRMLALSGLALLASSQASAEGHALGIRVGALGLGLEYTHELGERVAIRAGLNGSSFGFDAEESGIDYDFDLVWDSLSIAADFHPLASPLRLTAGFLRNDNRLEAESRPSGNLTIGGATYTPSEVGTLLGRAGFDDTAPFLGVGWDWSRKNRAFGLSFDLGVLDQGDAQVELVGTGALLGDPMFEADIAAEEAELRAELDDYSLVPYASLGFVFRF